jgi:hypothetical protein
VRERKEVIEVKIQMVSRVLGWAVGKIRKRKRKRKRKRTEVGWFAGSQSGSE